MMAHWCAVVGHPFYEVSDDGQVRSVAREVLTGSRWGGRRPKRWQSRVLRSWAAGAGYQVVSLGAARRRYVHHLVAEAFCLRPSPQHEVNHRNGDKTDNRASNLEWVTRRENQLHATHVLHKRGGQYLPKTARCLHPR